MIARRGFLAGGLVAAAALNALPEGRRGNLLAGISAEREAKARAAWKQEARGAN